MRTRETQTSIGKIMTALSVSGVLGVALSIAVSLPVARAALDLPVAHAGPVDVVTFYGLQFEGDSFVWCLDRGCSMGWGTPSPLDAVKDEVTLAIDSLSTNQEFSVVSFATDTSVWSPMPLPATVLNKGSAIAWLYGLTTSGWTCPEDALLQSLAISQQVSGRKKTIFLIGDGEAICNGTQAGPSVLANVSAANTENIPIHTFYLSEDPGGIAFFQELAELNQGIAIVVSEPLPPQFLRGDANSDGSVDGLVDSLFVLNYQFVVGSPAPLCLDSADADDSGSVSGLIDGLAILSFFFVPGSPAPPFPGPSLCNVDPPLDSLPCKVQPPCP